MTKFIIRMLIVIGVLFVIAQTALAGQVVSSTINGDTGVTLCRTNGSGSGVSLVGTIDLRTYGTNFTGIYSLQFPATVSFAARSLVTTNTYTGVTTGRTANSGVTLTYYYIVTLDSKTPAQLNALTTSAVTPICTMALNSSSTPWQIQRFLPEFGRYLHILAKAGVTDLCLPGALLGIQ